MSLGLERETARLLTLETALGAARMAIESSEDPATPRARVTSPGGTRSAPWRARRPPACGPPSGRRSRPPGRGRRSSVRAWGGPVRDSYLTDAPAFLVTTVFDLYILVVMLRFLFQWVRGDFYNPVSQFVVQLTNPPLRFLRRFVPGLGGVDPAALVLMLALKFLERWVVLGIQGVGAGPRGGPGPGRRGPGRPGHQRLHGVGPGPGAPQRWRRTPTTRRSGSSVT